MASLLRNPRQTASREYDVIIIGGGIYGITLALEAGRRGLKSLILEKGDFGEYTSFNSLKIIHGGLRYLQSLDLHRFKESVRERTWFLRQFPCHVKPLPCLMPLYGRGMKRPSVFRLALLINHLLSLDRNKELGAEHCLPMGKVLDVEETRKIFPQVDPQGLQGSAQWYDAFMPDSQLLVVELLKLACDTGTTALNYCQVRSLLTDSRGRMKGVMALDRCTATTFEFRAKTVINAAGPWCRKILSGIVGDEEALYRPSLAWNVAFNRPALSDHALAMQGKAPGSRLLFVTPWKGKIFVGCGHEPWRRGPEKPMPTKKQLEHFIDEVNQAVPGINLKLHDVSRVFAGLLPTVAAGSNILTKREVVVDHGAKGGPAGLYSVGGIKFTTARLVAEKIWKMIGSNNPGLCAPPDDLSIIKESSFGYGKGSEEYAAGRDDIDPSVVHLDDLVLRRSTVWEEGLDAPLELVAADMPWDEELRQKEIERCRLRLDPLPLEPSVPQHGKKI